MTLLELLERVDPRLLVLAALLVLLIAAVPALLIAWRARDDRRAAARARAVRPARIPQHMARRVWDFDSHGRTW